MKGGEAGAEAELLSVGMIFGIISEDKPLVTRITRHGKDFLFIFIYLMFLLWKFVTTSEYVQKNQSVVFNTSIAGPASLSVHLL
jgi:hypothetical protein